MAPSPLAPLLVAIGMALPAVLASSPTPLKALRAEGVVLIPVAKVVVCY